MRLVKKLLLSTLLLVLVIVQVMGQDSPNGTDSLQLTPDLIRIFKAENTSIFGEEYQGFIEKWNSNNFSPSQQEQIMLGLINLEKKGFRPRFDLKDIFASFNLAIDKRNFDAGRMDELSKALLKMSENYDKPAVQKYYETLRGFLDNMALRQGRGYGIFVENADYEIKYNGFDTEESDVVVLPAQEEVDINATLEDLQQPQQDVYDDSPVLMAQFGPVIEFKSADLVFRSRMDTIVLRGMNANFTFENEHINGIGGTIDWSSVGLPGQGVYAKLRDYDFGIDQKVIEFLDVDFHYDGKIPGPVMGNLTIHSNPPRNTQDSYPRFISTTADYAVNGLEGSGLEYRGGISYQGRKFYSKSAYDDKSTLTGRWDGETRFKALSTSFNFNKEDSSVTSKNASVTLYHGKDSVYHPVVDMEYMYGRGYLKLTPGKDGFLTTPFRTSFYNMDVVGDVLDWDLKSDSFNISTISARTEVPVLIESKNYYNSNRFYSLSELYNFHPLLMAIEMTKRVNSNSFYLSEMVDMSGVGEGVLERTMVNLMSKGLATFDPVTKLVTVTEKGFHYFEASQKESDYDDLIIPSITGASANATINTENNEMTVRGVEKFFLSDSLDVIITPKDGEIKVLENRRIEFDGSLEAGNFKFLGRKFSFSYDSFLVRLTEIDSIKLQVEIEPGKREALNNQLVQTSGVLQINEPNNKSGLKSIPSYPIFSSDASASVYFDKGSVLDKAYDSTVYFDVPPFQLDSAADADPSTFAFEGTFHSNGIFPEFKEDLVAMPDKSFGFIHSIPDSGYSLYGTRGRLNGEIRMDKKGITSPGNIEFLTANLNTESVTFYLDSMYSKKGIDGTIAPGSIDSTSFPSVKLKRYEVNWLAKKDSMNLSNLEEPFQIYDSAGQFDGMLTLSTTGLKGKGEMEIQGSTTKSDAYTLKETSFQARNSDFEIKSNNPRKPILKSADVKVSYNLKAQNAKISPEVQGKASIELPFAQYKTSIPEADWDIANNVITMTKPDTVPLEKSFFYATRKSMDSLAFSATGAVYDIEKQELTIEGIPYMVVADALITPDSNQVKVLENAEVEQLKNAVVVFDTAVANHRLYNATIDIISRNRFKGEGTYELVTVKDTFAIKFNEFRLEEDKKRGLYTKTSGEVKAEEEVRISPGFIYKGQVFMYAFRKALELKGAVKLDLKKLKERNVWIEYESNDDIAEVIFSFDQARTEFGDPLNAGLHFNNGDIYLSFITEKRGIDDDDFFIPSGGNLFYDQEEGTYNIANPQKTEDPANYYAGNMFSYNEDTQDVTFEGKLNFVSPFSKGIEFKAAGKGTGNLDSANFNVNAMLTVNMGLSPESVTLMGANLKEIGEKLGVKRAHDDRSDLIYKVAEFVGDEATKAWDNSYQTVPTPLVSAGPQLLKNLVLTNVDFKWSKQTKTFYSVGKLGVSNVGNTDLNMEMDGFVEVKKTPEGDVVNILLQLTDGTWYYFFYDGFTVGTYSSNTAYNGAISGKGGGKVVAYSVEEVIAWAQTFKKLHLGIDEPYRLLMAEDSNQTLKKKDTVEGDGF